MTDKELAEAKEKYLAGAPMEEVNPFPKIPYQKGNLLWKEFQGVAWELIWEKMIHDQVRQELTSLDATVNAWYDSLPEAEKVKVWQ